ncbi:hypothetical protein [Arthrobacter sp. B6]|uniref:hypothetical protein n=1 Tax=Arthrobacter sp. B6 TaxID=1570137 RepID=UPI00082B4C20|nr:hypothetical protein [Arthrobacter sp. B6]
MSQDNQPEEEVGGYGTPTAEQEMGGADNKQFAQPREEEDFDAAGLNQDSSAGETFPTGSPNLSHLAEEDQDSAGEPGAGRFGGTDEQYHAEADTNDPGFEPGEPPVPRDADLPSAEAEINESNADEQGSEAFSSESGQEAAGLPDGSGNDLPADKAPKDDDEESFDAG